MSGEPVSDDFEVIAAALGKLLKVKNKAYGDAFGKMGDVMRVLYPEGIKPEQYDDMLAVCRILDKLFRIASDRDALGESPYHDIARYGLLGYRRTLLKQAAP